jgi:ribosome biogenesis GTPase A
LSIDQGGFIMSNEQIQWYPGHMAKTRRHIAEDLALVDIVVEVTDARVPQSSRNQDLEPFASQKPLILVMNKFDMADAAATQKWLAFYKEKGFLPVATVAAKKQGIRELNATINEAAAPVYAKLAAKGRLRRPLRLMIVGIPNSGKSTLINALTPSANTKTGNKPGVTRGRQWVKTAAGFELLDTPGVLWPKFASEQTAFNLAATGAISDLVIPIYQISEQLLEFIRTRKPEAIMERYKLAHLPENTEEIFQAIGKNRGMLAAGGTVRTEDAAYVFLQEFRQGKLGRFTLDEI